MRIAFVVQRYGIDVHGGSEYHCRVWATHLAAHHEVTVFTTCARDYITWADYYPEGGERIDGVQVWRFPTDTPRDLAAFERFSETIFGREHTREQELEWMRLQGPYSTKLFEAIEAHREAFDIFIFMTYLYCSTFFGLPLVREKAVLVPTAHDEPPIYLSIFKDLFAAPRYMLYNTLAERRFLASRFNMQSIPGIEVGVGVDLPLETRAEPDTDSPTLLYIGRIHTSKGAEQLFEYFTRYCREDGLPARLIFVGRADITMPAHPNIAYHGFISEEEKQKLLSECAILVLPSPFESLSIVCLEAWAAGRPTLVNGLSDAMREQSLRSGGGLFYTSYEEFAGCLNVLLANRNLRMQLGQQGRQFVERRYAWPVVERRLEYALAEAIQRL